VVMVVGGVHALVLKEDWDEGEGDGDREAPGEGELELQPSGFCVERLLVTSASALPAPPPALFRRRVAPLPLLLPPPGIGSFAAALAVSLQGP